MRKVGFLLMLITCLLLFENTYIKTYAEDNEKSGITVTMLDVSQGESFLIQVNDKTILLDTGEKKYYEFLKRQLKYYKISKIDLLIISHMDTDHMGAATLVIQDFDIDAVFIPHTPGESNEYNKLVNLIEKRNVRVKYAERGKYYSVGEKCLLSVYSVDMVEEKNDSSIVMKISYLNNSFLFTGDASASVLNGIMEEGYDISADVLKVPHHGSDSSSPILFLKNVNARIALISVGRDNIYGHPTENVIRRLKNLNCDIYRTDIEGTVIVKGDGDTLRVSCEKIVDWDAEERLKVESGPIIGNINSKVYHNEDCLSLPADYNRIFFLKPEDAEESGYRPCSMCIDVQNDSGVSSGNNFVLDLAWFFLNLLKKLGTA